MTIRRASFERLEDLNTLALVFAEHADGTGGWLAIQRSLAFDEQDRMLGMDMHCVCLSTGQTAYGAVKSWLLRGRLLKVEFNEQGAEILGAPSVELILTVKRDVFQKVRRGLDEILAPA